MSVSVYCIIMDPFVGTQEKGTYMATKKTGARAHHQNGGFVAGVRRLPSGHKLRSVPLPKNEEFGMHVPGSRPGVSSVAVACTAQISHLLSSASESLRPGGSLYGDSQSVFALCERISLPVDGHPIVGRTHETRNFWKYHEYGAE